MMYYFLYNRLTKHLKPFTRQPNSGFTYQTQVHNVNTMWLWKVVLGFRKELIYKNGAVLVNSKVPYKTGSSRPSRKTIKKWEAIAWSYWDE